MRNNELKIGKHYRCEYRLTGIDCKILNWTAGATGVFNVSGGNRLAFSAVDGRTLTVSQAKWGQLAAGMEIFIHTTAADPDGPRIAKIAELDPDAGTITLVEDLGVPAEALANVGKWIGATPELTRPESAFAAGAYVFATGKHAVAVGRNVAAAADESFLIGADGELPGTPEYEGAVAVAHGGELVLLVKHYKMAENAETGEPERVPSPSLTFSGVVIADEFRKADGTPIGGEAGGLQDAPIDGKYYVRKDGAWEDITGILSPDPSYSNPGGMGNRQTIIAATTNITGSGFNVTKLIDGAAANDTEWSGNTAGSYLRFQFASAKLITEMKFYMSGAQDNGTWKVQGSSDGSTWTDIGSTFAFNSTPLAIDLSANTTKFLYYQLLGVSGSLGTVHYEQEIEFKISK